MLLDTLVSMRAEAQIGKGMFYYFYLRGFPTENGYFSRISRGCQFGGYSRANRAIIKRNSYKKHASWC